MKGIKNENGERKAYTAFGETEFGKMGFGKTGFGETERHRQLCVALTVRQLSPLLHCPLFHDQYAYKPTGSTTCALVDFTYRIHSAH